MVDHSAAAQRPPGAKYRVALHGLTLVATLLAATGAAATEWRTVFASPSDTVSDLFRVHGARQADLAALLRAPRAAGALGSLRADDALELRTDAHGKLVGLRLHTAKRSWHAERAAGRWRVTGRPVTARLRTALAVRRLEMARVTAPATRQAAPPGSATTVAGPVTTPDRQAEPRPAIAAPTVVRALEPDSPPAQRAARAGSALPLATAVRGAEHDVSRLRRTVARRVVWALETGQPIVLPPASTAAAAAPVATGVAATPRLTLVRAVRSAESDLVKRRARLRARLASLRNDPRILAMLQGARSHIGVPYLWGGTTPKGFDCSGLVVYHARRVGIDLPRTAHAQFVHTRSRPVSRHALAPGDLVFFRDADRPSRIGHVGIYVGNNRFIHAVGDDMPVQITPMSRPHYARRFVRGGRIVG